MSHRHHRSLCPICSSPQLKPQFVVAGFTIVHCARCRAQFTLEVPDEAELDAYYAQAAIGVNTSDDSVYLADDNLDNLRYYFAELRANIHRWVRGGRLLDVGCNAGHFLDVMTRFEGHGIERSPGYGRIAAQRHGPRIFVGAFEHYPIPTAPFSCITLQDVLDHLVDPLAALKRCHGMLADEGLLVVKVHDYSSLVARLFGRHFYPIIPPCHLFYFTRRALTNLLHRAGFAILAAKHMGHRMFLRTVLLRLARERQGGIWLNLYERIKGTSLGRWRLYKNLHDVITVFACKRPWCQAWAGPPPRP